MKNSKNFKKERALRKKETRRIAKNHENTTKQRLKAKIELNILVNLFSSDIESELDTFKEIKFHLEASQKELTYFGFRGITIGIIVVILTNLITNKGLPIIFDISEQMDKFPTLLDKTIMFAVLIITVMILTGVFVFAYYQFASPFLNSEKKIREQLYINEYMIKMVEEKIKFLSN